MFERYTESARRAVFFAQYEASVVGAREIDALDLVRGIVRESKSEAQCIEWIRLNRDRVSSTLWPPERKNQQQQSDKAGIKLSHEAKLALAHAAQVAESNPHGSIHAQTLLLGILSFENPGAQLLNSLGLTIESARAEVLQLHEKYPPQLPSRLALVKGALRTTYAPLIKVLLFLIVVFAGVALVNWINR